MQRVVAIRDVQCRAESELDRDSQLGKRLREYQSCIVRSPGCYQIQAFNHVEISQRSSDREFLKLVAVTGFSTDVICSCSQVLGAAGTLVSLESMAIGHDIALLNAAVRCNLHEHDVFSQVWFTSRPCGYNSGLFVSP